MGLYKCGWMLSGGAWFSRNTLFHSLCCSGKICRYNWKKYFAKCFTTFSAPGRSAYFVNSPGRYNLKADTEEKLTPLECMDRCIANVECVMFNYYTTTEGCALCFNDTGIHVNKENAYEKLIVRCNQTQRELSVRYQSNHWDFITYRPYSLLLVSISSYCRTYARLEI